MSRKTWRSIVAGITTAALLITTPSIAQASDDPIGSITEGSTNDVLLDVIAGSSQHVGSTGVVLGGLLSGAGLLSSGGSSELSGPFLSSEDGYPLPTDDSITAVELVSRSADTRAPRLERWHVASPSMKRVVEVQVMLPADEFAEAPMLYMLDGIGGNRVSSGWINTGAAQDVFADENVTVIMPLGAAGSLYSDWEQDDPALGTIKWETFITEELAPLLEATPDLNFNGRRGIGGLSMGAIGAVHLANSRPDLFDAVMGISGCYSTLDNLGRQTTSLIVASRGGNVENMWGPFGSQTWIDHDVVRDPSGLVNQTVYLSAANGAAGDDDIDDYSDNPFYDMIAGLYLERGVLRCTRDLERSLEDAGAIDVQIDYLDTGMHNWVNYAGQLQPAWDSVKHALL